MSFSRVFSIFKAKFRFFFLLQSKRNRQKYYQLKSTAYKKKYKNGNDFDILMGVPVGGYHDRNTKNYRLVTAGTPAAIGQ